MSSEIGNSSQTDQCPECPALQYCLSLGTMGVRVAKNGECHTGDEPWMGGGELAELIGVALSETLEKREATRTDREKACEIREGHQKVLKARFELWRAMLASPLLARRFTDVEYKYYTKQIERAEKELKQRTIATMSGYGEGWEQIWYAGQWSFDKSTIDRYGLLFDEQMISTINQVVANTMNGQPTLLTSEPGLAKTALARFVAGPLSASGGGTDENKARFISADGSMMKDEFIGKIELVVKDGATATTFSPGIVVECMEQGLPLVFDEVNFADPSILSRLHEIMLIKPGESLTIQENGGRKVVVKPGFTIIATRNNESAQNIGRNRLDNTFFDRCSEITLGYPEVDPSVVKKPLEHEPDSLYRLAYAAAVDDDGFLGEHVKSSELDGLCRLAYVTQYLSTVPMTATGRATKTSLGLVSTTDVFDDQPAMSSRITPRKLAGAVASCAHGNSGNTICSVTDRLVASLGKPGSQDRLLAEKIRKMFMVGNR